MQMKKKTLIGMTVLFVVGLFGLASCAKAPLMVPTQKLTEKDMNHAIVTFVRSGVMSPTQKAEIWDRDTPVGELTARAYIQYQATPGRHLFMSKGKKSDKWSYIEANLITGEHYVVKVDILPGGYSAWFKLTPTSPKDGQTSPEDVEKWLNDLNGKRLLQEMIPTFVEQRGGAAKRAVKAYEEGKMVPEILSPEDFWPDSH